MIFPILQNTVHTVEAAADGVIQVGTHPLIERTSPLAPGVRETLFPTLVSQLSNVRGLVT